MPDDDGEFQPVGDVFDRLIKDLRKRLDQTGETTDERSTEIPAP